jgi:hypothetical protein
MEDADLVGVTASGNPSMRLAYEAGFGGCFTKINSHKLYRRNFQPMRHDDDLWFRLSIVWFAFRATVIACLSWLL